MKFLELSIFKVVEQHGLFWGGGVAKTLSIFFFFGGGEGERGVGVGGGGGPRTYDCHANSQ